MRKTPPFFLHPNSDTDEIWQDRWENIYPIDYIKRVGSFKQPKLSSPYEKTPIYVIRGLINRQCQRFFALVPMKEFQSAHGLRAMIQNLPDYKDYIREKLSRGAYLEWIDKIRRNPLSPSSDES